ncbi:MAG TPA: hypothetical protein VG367_04575 [Mucilaginibacter sp.]|jgi:hypothetical protein|nr:hypothetical protein [Mucilaginibacter sp.]
MNVIPFERLVLNSELSETELTVRLNDYVEPFRFSWNNFRKSSKLYVGRINEKEFGIRRIVRGRNSFVPYVHGRFGKKGNGTEIIITMRLHYMVMSLLLFFIGFLIFARIKYHEITPLMFILFIYLMTMYFFNEECNKAKSDLRDILEANPAPV